MPAKRETATQRHAREAMEARIAAAKWNEQKHLRLLQAMAAASDVNVRAQVFYRGVLICYSFSWDTYGDDVLSEPVADLTEWQMQSIEQRLSELREAELKRQRLAQVRAQVLERLSDEEREALGLT
jgi:hypothetical protein